MKIACITQVRDECDIIELFVRINARVFDHIYIIDNNSADATPIILKKLQDEGLPITIGFHPDNTYNQDAIITTSLRNVNVSRPYDWYMFLDADEFIDATKEDLLEAFNSVPKHLTPKCLWRSWIPSNLDYFKHTNPLYTCFNPLGKENFNTFKAVIDNKKVPFVIINHGNHAWIRVDNEKPWPDMDCGIRINHFPVRSVEQITSKAVLSHYRQGIRNISKTQKGEVHKMGPPRRFYQLSDIHENLREIGFNITHNVLKMYAYRYNVELVPNKERTMYVDPPHISSEIKVENFGFEEDIIQYPELSKIHLGARFDKQMDIMQGVMNKMYKRFQELGHINI